KLLHSWRVQTSRNRTSDELGLLLSLLIQSKQVKIEKIEHVAIACVVPPMIRAFKEMSVKYFHQEPFFIEPGIKTGMPILYDNPKEVGADRIVNSVAAYREYGAPIVVVDFGTATTFDVISSRGEYIGGVIAPGIRISSEALFQHAARLPRVEIVYPECVIGKNTIASMQSGLFYGYIGLVNEISSRIVNELNQECTFIGTGGLVELIAPFSKYPMVVDIDLTLKGITILYELNINNE
ncbi:MAG: pantothenate kinase, partial [Candidatus Fischerbacteria bacterium RBG_13_37_8]